MDRRASTAVKNFQCARHSIISVIGPTKVGPGEKIFKNKVLRRLEKKPFSDWFLQIQ